MRLTLLVSLLGIAVLTTNDQWANVESNAAAFSSTIAPAPTHEPSELNFQNQPADGKMRAVVFKNQDYCRAELKDFDFDFRFSVLSARVYFSGAGFSHVEQGFLTSNKLEPIKKLMDRCTAGSLVVFDDIKVIGSNNEIRSIDGVSYLLY